MKILNRLLMRAVFAVIFTALSGLCLGQASAPASLDHKHSTPTPPGVASPHNIEGKVEGGGPIAKATVTLWAAGPGAPQKLAETQTKDDGSFGLKSAGRKPDGGVLYLIAKGGEPKVGGDRGLNPAITLMATLGTTPPKRVTVNELTS